LTSRNKDLILGTSASKEEAVLEEAYYTVEEVSALFRVTKATVWKWLREGKMRFVWIGSEKRIPATALKEFIRPGTPEQPENSQKNLEPTLGV
jgi:excisionase family DNA binding protein